MSREDVAIIVASFDGFAHSADPVYMATIWQSNNDRPEINLACHCLFELLGGVLTLSRLFKACRRLLRGHQRRLRAVRSTKVWKRQWHSSIVCDGDLNHRVRIIFHFVLLDIIPVYRYNMYRKKVLCYDDPRCIEG